MKEKINTICLVLITIAVIVFTFAYAFRTLIDVGCSSPNFYSIKETGTNLEQIFSAKFLNVNCAAWNGQFQFQPNY